MNLHYTNLHPMNLHYMNLHPMNLQHEVFAKSRAASSSLS